MIKMHNKINVKCIKAELIISFVIFIGQCFADNELKLIIPIKDALWLIYMKFRK